MATIRRTDFIALSQDPNVQYPVLPHVHSCPDVTVPSFPFGPLLRDMGICDEALPLCCASCGRTTYQPCRNTYRVCHTGADWNGVRDEFRRHREMPILVQCQHCNAPSDFHIQLALFKLYYEEVFDMVRDGRVTLYDLRRSVTVVSHWPPRPDDILMRRLSGLASQVSEAIGTLPGGVSALVMEYWQGVTQDYLSPHTKFVFSMDMYKCDHVWPCANHETFDRPCLWMRWSQHWVHELHLCDAQSYHFMNLFPLTWQSWVDQRTFRSAPLAPVHESLRLAPWGMFDSFGDGDDFLKMAECHPTLGPIALQENGPYFKNEHRCHDAWYKREVPLTPHTYVWLGGRTTEALSKQLPLASILSLGRRTSRHHVPAIPSIFRATF